MLLARLGRMNRNGSTPNVLQVPVWRMPRLAQYIERDGCRPFLKPSPTVWWQEIHRSGWTEVRVAARGIHDPG